MSSTSSEQGIKGNLLHFDWQIRHVLGSSASRNLEESLTQVSFIVKNEKEGEDLPARSVTVEFSKNELKQLISTLQRSLEN